MQNFKMDITALDYALKKVARKCFENFKHFFIYNPIGVYDNDILEASIESEISQSFGGKIYKRFLHNDITEVQFEYLTKELNKYKGLTLKVAYNFGAKFIKNTKQHCA